MKSVAVYVKGREAGVLGKFRDGTYEFRYTRRYLDDSRLPPAAFAFPKRPDAFRSRTLFPFFFGLLTEGEQKERQCRLLKIDERDYFTRLAETCREGVIGAVYVLPRKGFARRRATPR